MKKKMNKKTRNVVSGIMVSIAAIFAVISFADIPASDVGRFILSTVIFFIAIVLLALLAVTVFKLIGWLKNCLLKSDVDDELTYTDDLVENLSEETDYSEGINESKEK